MVQVEFANNSKLLEIDPALLVGKRHLTENEIELLKKNRNNNTDDSWKNFYVDEKGFDPNLVIENHFEGLIILGIIVNARICYNDLKLDCGIFNSSLKDVVTGDYDVIKNAAYLENYRLGKRVIIFNVQEMCCTNHCKFGNGILKEGEPEENRIWIGVANENDGRRILPFENLIPADAYIWSHYRFDQELLNRFVELTENKNDRKLNTYGIVGDDSVIKNSLIIKDTKIGSSAYIKGALKLKNITILSSEAEKTQIGEGVEMVNGILGYGCHVFYQAIAVRFVIGRNCQVKYGARLLNSVLGDNSTVSCCEILNNLIFPFHEQHHNSSFLIATTIMGQSNIASGATIGSNHNSRSPDGEIFAKRGFWPGLCSDFKHNSRFASFDLISKGSYQYELDIPYPFALVSPGQGENQAISITPAWWFMYDMFAISRNKNKFIKRDRRKIKIQNIETDPMAPDTMQEILSALDRIIGLTAEYLKSVNYETMKDLSDPKLIRQCAKDYLHQNPNAVFALMDMQCQKKYGAVINKPVKAYRTYRKVVKYYAVRTLMEYCDEEQVESLDYSLIEKIRNLPLYTQWENAGGQIIPGEKIRELFQLIKDRKINDWDGVHDFYNQCQADYKKYVVRYALFLLEQLYSRPIEDFTMDIYMNVIDDVKIYACDIYNAALESREKDYTDYYRNMVYSSKDEMDAVIGSLNENSFLIELRKDTGRFVDKLEKIFNLLVKA